MSPSALAVSVTLGDGTTHRRYVEPDPSSQDDLTIRLEGLDSAQRMQLISLILQTENELVSWEEA